MMNNIIHIPGSLLARKNTMSAEIVIKAKTP